jgi:hypothetical protein
MCIDISFIHLHSYGGRKRLLHVNVFRFFRFLYWGLKIANTGYECQLWSYTLSKGDVSESLVIITKSAEINHKSVIKSNRSDRLAGSLSKAGAFAHCLTMLSLIIVSVPQPTGFWLAGVYLPTFGVDTQACSTLHLFNYCRLRITLMSW